MKHVSHLVFTDIRRFWVALALWVSVLIGDAMFQVMRDRLTADAGLTTGVVLLGSVLFLGRWIGLGVIVPLVVQSDPLVGSTAFWMTRPIPWRSLLASKIVVLWTAWVLVPAAAEVVLMLAYQVTGRQIVLVTIQTLLLQSLWLFVVMVLAAATQSLARFALAVGGLLLCAALSAYIALTWALRNTPDGSQLHEVADRTSATPSAVVTLVVLVIAAAVVQLVMRYRRQSARAAVGIGVASIAAIYLIVTMWLPIARPLPVPDWVSRDDSLRLAADGTRGEFQSMSVDSPWTGPGRWHLGSLPVRLTGLAEGWRPMVRLAESSVQFEDGRSMTTIRNGYVNEVGLKNVDEPPEVFVVRRVLGVDRMWGDWKRPSAPMEVLAIAVAHADFETYLGKKGTYGGRFLVDLDRVDVTGVMAPRAGSECQDRRSRTIVDRVSYSGSSAAIRIRNVMTTTMFESNSAWLVSYYLRNRTSSEAVAGQVSVSVTSLALSDVTFSLFAALSLGRRALGFVVADQTIRFPAASQAEEGMPEFDTEWWSQAELVVVSISAAGSVSRALEVQGFEVAVANPARLSSVP